MPKPFRSNLKRMIIFAAVAVVLLVALLYKQFERSSPGIKIGVLHSLSGSMAESEAPLVDVIRLSVEQTNRAGGLNGRQIEMIVADCRSEAAYCAQEAERLITREDVKALSGAGQRPAARLSSKWSSAITICYFIRYGMRGWKNQRTLFIPAPFLISKLFRR